MVDLLPLELSEDLDTVEALIREFYDVTGSAVAASLLSKWPETAKLFVKVRPHPQWGLERTKPGSSLRRWNASLLVPSGAAK